MEWIVRIYIYITSFFERKPFKASSFSLDINRVNELERRYRTILTNAGILESNSRKAMFWAQLAHESGLRPIRENLNYSAQGLLKTFPRHFTPTMALKYARRPEAIANRAYANRMGNGPESTGDGWKHRGRGFIQNTGKSQYRTLNKIIPGVLDDPDLLLLEANAMVAALDFWTKNNINRFADKNDVRGASIRINGGTNGLQDRNLKYKTLIRYYGSV
jgi:putative chitinase